MSQLAIRDPRALEAIKKASREHRIATAYITGPFRHRQAVNARCYAAWLMRHILGMSYPEIGYYLNRDHSTVMTMLKKLKEQA